MPNYDYKCEKCENIQEEYHKMSESPKIKCKKCGSKNMKKVLTGYQVNMNYHPGTKPEDY